MNTKGKMKKILSGLLTVLTIVQTAISPISAYASEKEKEKPPLYEEVKELLDADEVVTAKDYEIEIGCQFDISRDFSNLEIPDQKKLKVIFQEAKNDVGKDFTIEYADTYTAVYYVEPLTTDHPTYQISRNLIVKEQSTEVQSDTSGQPNQGAGESEESEPQSDVGILSSQTSDAETKMDMVPETDTETEVDTETESAEDMETERTSETVTELEETKQPGTESKDMFPVNVIESESETSTEEAVETEVESEIETETETETELESETETESNGDYQVTVTKGKEFHITLNHADGKYNAGERVEFSAVMPEGCLTAVAALKVKSNEEKKTADILYSEVSYLVDKNTFCFEMPAEDVALEVAVDYAEGGIAMYAAEEDNLWDDATEIEANTYYYYSDGKLHPFDSVMGQGGNDSYKYVRYKVNGKTYTVNAYCMQHSMPSPPSGTSYKNMIELDEGGDDKYLRKAFFYGYGGPGWGHTFNGYNIKKIMEDAGCTTETRAMQHYLVDYLYDGESGFGGALSETAKNMLQTIKAALAKMPDPTAMELLPSLSVTADGKQTKTFTWKANEAFKITIQLEDGVSLVNETTGKTSTGDVTVKGGDKFHLVATANDISKLEGKYAITSNYPLDFHAMLLKLQNSQDIGFGYYTGSSDLSITVDWPEEAQIDIVKKDRSSNAKLAGAVYGIYSDAACTDLIVQMPATDANGASSMKLEKTQDTVYLKEISVPNGYVLDTKAYNIKLVAGGSTTQTVTDVEQLASLTVYKNGEVLTGANVTENGVTFVYTEQRQKGAVYNVYAGADITAADGTLVYKKGALVKEGLITGEDGSATLDNLHLGTYTVKEMKAPENLICTGESQNITLSYAGSNEEKVMGSVSFTNARQKASVLVGKQDQETKQPLADGIYGLYAGNDIKSSNGSIAVKKDTLIETVTTKTDGTAAYQADPPIGNGYYIKELQAPQGYILNSNDIYSFTFHYTSDKEATVSFIHIFQNERANAAIHLVKKDKEIGERAQGDASLKDAVYGVYAREDIMHPDGKSGVIYKAGEQVATLTTDAEGKAEVGNLYLGKYYVKEINPPVGYLLDEEEHELDCTYEGDKVQTVERIAVSTEQVMKQPFQIIKAGSNGNTDAELLKGAGFTAYLESSLKKNEDGTYDFTSTQPVVLTADGKTEMFTDEKGYVCSIALPYGVYVVRETTTPHNFKPVRDFKVTISENNPTKPQIWRVLLDEEFKAKLKIVKKDDETKQTVLVPNTEFKVYDLDHKKYVEQVTTYPSTIVHKSYFTDSTGYLVLPQALECGNYRIEEVSAPDGYILNKNYVVIEVDSDTAYQMDQISGDAIIEVTYENHPAKGKLTIHKNGEALKDFDGDFRYEELALAGAVFEITAAEDIYTPDFQIGADGNRNLKYVKGTLMATVTTDEDGNAFVEELPLGRYCITEKKAPDGYVLTDKSEELEFVYKGQDTPVIDEEVTITDERQKVSITVEKQDAETGVVVAGAVFAIYNRQDIVSGGDVIVKADTKLGEATSDEKGQAVFALDLPLGEYYVKEISAPVGYASSSEVLEFDATYQGQEVKVITLKSVKKNQPTTIEVKKSDITTGVELDGASLSVLDKDGNVVDSWTSVKDVPHIIKNLVIGEAYTLWEEFAPFGYLKTTDVEFVVEDNGDVQKVEMKDEVPKALLIVNKKGEFLDKVTLRDNVTGMVEHLFEYVTGSLQDVTFEVYAAKAIKSADGVSGDYYSADELVATIKTDANGIAKAEELPVGKYYVKEVETAYGYVLDGEPRYVDLSYRDQDTPIVVFDEDWQNNRQKVKVNVLKKEKDSERPLEGGVFGLFTEEEIMSVSGKVLMEAETLIEQKVTDAEGKISFMADLPVGGKYYVKEICAPDGFVTTGETQEFVFEYQGADAAEVTYDFSFENEQTTVELSKTDLTNGEELPGAQLRVIDENANLIDEWVSTSEPHMLKGLVVGKSYTMLETKPADGYATAESIVFTVENTVEIQKYEMRDDVTKVEISKTDITGETEIPGAKLTILDKDGKEVESWTSGKKPHYIEKLPIGTYTLREEQAPKGYVIAEEVVFEVTDTDEIQKVQMKDEAAKGRVHIEKTDKESGKALEGVEFEFRDENGKVLETLKTDVTGHAESGLYEIAAYKNGKYKEARKYYLVETKTLDGYVLDSTEHEIIFDYVDDKTPVIEILEKVVNEAAPPNGNPQTGDSSRPWIPVLLMVLSGTAFAGAILVKKRKKRGQ